MADFFKDYGAAIGPSLAFLLGLIALWIKHYIDLLLASRLTNAKYTKLKVMLFKAKPPEYCLVIDGNSKDKNARLPRNITNIARFYNKLLGVAPLIKHLEGELYTHGAINDINTFNNMKWWFEIIRKDVERMCSSGVVNEDDIDRLNHDYNNLIESLDDSEHMTSYDD